MINGITLNQRFSGDNIGPLINALDSTTTLVPEWQKTLWAKIAKDLRVHTQGEFFMKTIDLFEEEPKEGKDYNIKSYEPITKSSINKGLLELSRIFSNTSSTVTIELDSKESLPSTLNDYVSKWVDIAQAKDPNAKAVVVDNKIKIVESIDIMYIDNDSLIYIDRENSDYVITKQTNTYLKGVCGKKEVESFYYHYKPEYSGKRTIVIENRYQRISATKGANDSNYTVTIVPRGTEIIGKPYIDMGVKEIMQGVYESAMQPFIPFGNLALLTHKTSRQIETLFGYPRMTEVESACEAIGCLGGKVQCTDSEKIAANGGNMLYEDCSTCGGSGHISSQTLWRIYKKKIQPNVTAADNGLNIPSVEYHLPPIESLDRTHNMWLEFLDLAEKSIYVFQKKETGNTQTAEAKEKELQEKYNSYIKSSDAFYNGLEKILRIMHGNNVTVEKPLSLAIMGEIEAFNLLELISASSAPAFLKTAHLASFLNRYVSQSNPVVKAVNMLKKYDLFLFYTNSEIDALDGIGGIIKEDKLFHVYAFPTLMQMYYEDNDIFSSPRAETELLKRVGEKTKQFADLRLTLQEQLTDN